MADDDDVICLSDSEDEITSPTIPSSIKNTQIKGAGPVLKGIYKNPSGQSTLAFSKRIKKPKKTEIEEEPETSQTSLKPVQKPIDTFFSKGHPDGMTISVKNCQSVKGGQTEVKIVVPNMSAPLPSSSSLKKTARKAMSSFTPQLNKKMRIEVKPEVEAEVIDLSDEEPAPDVGSSGKAEKLKISESPASSCKTEGVEKKEPIQCEVNKAFADFLSASKGHMTVSELDRIKYKFQKKIANLTNDVKTRHNMTKLIREKTDVVASEGKNVFVHINDIFGQMSLHKKRRIALIKADKPEEKSAVAVAASAVVASTSSSNPPSSSTMSAAEREKSEKRDRTIRRLEKALMQCKVAIDKLEQGEIDLDSVESSYLKEDRYKRKFMQIFRAIAKLREEDPSLDRRVDKRLRLGDVSRIPAVNVKIEKLINRKQKLKSENSKRHTYVVREFPDFPDILKAFTSANEEQNLGFSEKALHLEAEKTFRTVGEQLKARRIEDDLEDLYSYLPEQADNVDPADEVPEIAEKLRQSLEDGKKKMAEVVEQFVQKQMEGKTTDSNSNEDGEESAENSEEENESVDENSGNENDSGGENNSGGENSEDANDSGGGENSGNDEDQDEN